MLPGEINTPSIEGGTCFGFSWIRLGYQYNSPLGVRQGGKCFQEGPSSLYILELGELNIKQSGTRRKIIRQINMVLEKLNYVVT